MPTKAGKAAKFKDKMRPEYDMSGGVRGKYTSRRKADEQAYNEIFSKVGFDESLRMQHSTEFAQSSHLWMAVIQEFTSVRKWGASVQLALSPVRVAGR
jgi:hypothetical protein